MLAFPVVLGHAAAIGRTRNTELVRLVPLGKLWERLSGLHACARAGVKFRDKVMSPTQPQLCGDGTGSVAMVSLLNGPISMAFETAAFQSSKQGFHL